MSRSTIIALAVLMVFVLLLAIVVPSTCRSLFTAKQEARVAKGQAGAAIEAGAEAMNTVGAAENMAAARRSIVKEGTDEIEKAEPGNSNDAAERAACRLRSYRDSERCARLRPAGP